MRSDGVSFIIPNWNHELVLPRALHSAFRAGEGMREQGLGFEVLVADDASRDGSRVLLRQLEALYADRGLRVLALRANAGPAGARAAALDRATFRHVVFMDADNEVAPENLSTFYRAARQTEAAVVYGNLLVHDEAQTVLCSHESFLRRIFAGNYIDTFSLCDAEQLHDVGGFWADARNVREDWELFLHLAVSGRRLVHVPLVFGYYYRNRNSRVTEANTDEAGERLIQRIFRQFPEVREESPLNTLGLRYHPDVGWL